MITTVLWMSLAIVCSVGISSVYLFCTFSLYLCCLYTVRMCVEWVVFGVFDIVM